MSYEKHILKISDPKEHRSILLDIATISIGRDPDVNSIVLHSKQVSRQHCYLIRVPKGDNEKGYYYNIYDGNLKGQRSTNGITVNGKKVSEHRLQNGNHIELGPDCHATYYVETMTEESTNSSVKPVSSAGKRKLSAIPNDMKKTIYRTISSIRNSNQPHDEEKELELASTAFYSNAEQKIHRTKLWVILTIMGMGIILISVGLTWQLAKYHFQSPPEESISE
jgi:pSer/pThr/pTyr-binding forkhead associated (FHA) protein